MERAPPFGGGQVCIPNKPCAFVDPGGKDRDTVYLQGDWTQEKDLLRANAKKSWLRIVFVAREINLVMKPPKGKEARVELLLDGKPISKKEAGDDVKFEKGKSIAIIDRDDMYNLMRSDKFEQRELKIIVEIDGIEMFAFTFG